MGEAIAIAHGAVRTGDVPVGAIVLNKDGVVIGNSEDGKKMKKVIQCVWKIG